MAEKKDRLKEIRGNWSDDYCDICLKRSVGTSKLYGGRVVTLCNRHINEWHDFITEQSSFAYGNKVKIKLDVSIRQGKEIRTLELHEELVQQYSVAYELSGLWLENKREEWIEEHGQNDGR